MNWSGCGFTGGERTMSELPNARAKTARGKRGPEHRATPENVDLTRRSFLKAGALGVVSFAVAPLAAACAGPSSSGSPSPATASKVVNLFGIQALTGPSSPSNIITQACAEYAVKEINDAGGV